DAYLAGAREALSPLEKYGLTLFVRMGCMQCHWGPRLTDDAFHVTRTPTGRRDGAADRGRVDGLLGQIKTPPLRGVADLSHWGHGGAFDSLAAVMESYGKGGVPPGDAASAGAREPWLVPFGETVQWALVPFLKTLTARPIAP